MEINNYFLIQSSSVIGIYKLLLLPLLKMHTPKNRRTNELVKQINTVEVERRMINRRVNTKQKGK